MVSRSVRSTNPHRLGGLPVASGRLAFRIFCGVQLVVVDLAQIESLRDAPVQRLLQALSVLFVNGEPAYHQGVTAAMSSGLVCEEQVHMTPLSTAQIRKAPSGDGALRR